MDPSRGPRPPAVWLLVEERGPFEDPGALVRVWGAFSSEAGAAACRADPGFRACLGDGRWRRCALWTYDLDPTVERIVPAPTAQAPPG